jgi:drug/metabolite transporter (DMT)-like permease
MAAYAALAFLSLLWGSSFLLIKIAARAFDPFALALVRGGVAAGTLIIAGALTGRVWPARRPGLWRKLLALSLIGQVIPFLLLGKAAQMTTSADMALMMGSAPVFVLLAGRVVGSGDRWTLQGALGLALGFAGVGLVLWSPATRTAGAANPVEGRAIALMATFGYAMGALISARVTREIGAAKAVAASMTLSTLTLALIGLAFGAESASATIQGAPLGPVLAVIALGVFNTALAYFVYFRLVVSEGPTFASLNNYLVPIIGAVGGALALGEPVGFVAWAGLALVLASVALTGRSLRRARLRS